MLFVNYIWQLQELSSGVTLIRVHLSKLQAVVVHLIGLALKLKLIKVYVFVVTASVTNLPKGLTVIKILLVF